MLELYSYYRSPASYRVRIALNLKEQKYKYISVHLVKNGGEQHTPSYKKTNPQELVPTLVDGKTVLSQSLAIIEYLDEKFPAPPLLPEKPAERAFVRQIALICAADTQPLTTLRVLNHLSGEMGVAQAAKTAWAEKWIGKCFDAVEKWLDTSPCHKDENFACGKHVTLADICLVAQAYDAARLGMSLDPWPRVAGIVESCLKRDAFKQASPENQPDTPEDQRMKLPKGLSHS